MMNLVDPEALDKFLKDVHPGASVHLPDIVKGSRNLNDLLQRKLSEGAFNYAPVHLIDEHELVKLTEDFLVDK